MSDATFSLLACGAALLLLGAAALVLFGGASSARMRQRVRAATGIDARPVDDTGPNIRITAPDERRPLQRFAEALGYNLELPPAYAASLPVVIGAASLGGLLVFWRVRISFGDIAGGLAAVATAMAVARFLLRRKTRLYTAALFRQIPDTISLILRAVRAGLPVADALRSVSREMPSPSRDEFARVVGEAALGVPLETALWHMYLRTRIREFAFFAVTLGLHGQTGGNLAETLENLADMVRRRVAMAAKARALAAEARTSATILAGLPFICAGAIVVLNPNYLEVLFADPRGINLLVVFAVLLSLGLLTIRWLIQRSTQD